jgi:hypothetical protein
MEGNASETRSGGRGVLGGGKDDREVWDARLLPHPLRTGLRQHDPEEKRRLDHEGGLSTVQP